MTMSLDFQIVSGVKFPKLWDRNKIDFALNYEPKSGDKFVVTYPKAGTTWTQQIMNLISNNGVFGENDKYVMGTAYLEYSGPEVQTFPAIKTHIPFDVIPRRDDAKYLLVFRNPKDCCVSSYYHALNNYPELIGDFHQYFQHWIKGDVCYGDYFTHVYDYWSHRFDKNFDFLVYEQMIENPREAVLKIARFMGQEFIERLASNEVLLNEIIRKSSIVSMKSQLNLCTEDQIFMRKGIVGDWRDHFDKEESDLIDNRIATEFEGTGLDTLWSNHIKWNIE